MVSVEVKAETHRKWKPLFLSQTECGIQGRLNCVNIQLLGRVETVNLQGHQFEDMQSKFERKYSFSLFQGRGFSR